ncbi:hypothetical protein TSAR_002434, partial [Trichomalopsis sarcophagae]
PKVSRKTRGTLDKQRRGEGFSPKCHEKSEALWIERGRVGSSLQSTNGTMESKQP